MNARQPQLSLGIRNYASTPPADWRHVLEQARAAEDAGIDRVFVSDHLVFGADLEAYGDPASGGRTGGRQPTGPDGDWLEALTTLAALAAVTNRVLLATNVLVAPLRPAVLLAKVAGSIDALSGGRFELGVGIGWQRAEYRALGVEFARRGEILDELLDVCRELWTSPVAVADRSNLQLADVHMMPKPAGVPIWIGGGVLPVVARRLARHGAGWIPWGVAPDGFVDAVARMRDLVTSAGGEGDSIRVAYPLPTLVRPDGGIDHAAMFAPVRELVARGIDDFRTLLRVPPDYDGARVLLDELAGHFRDATS